MACITVWTALWRLTIRAEMKRVRDRGDAAQRHDPEMAEPELSEREIQEERIKTRADAGTVVPGQS